MKMVIYTAFAVLAVICCIGANCDLDSVTCFFFGTFSERKSEKNLSDILYKSH